MTEREPNSSVLDLDRRDLLQATGAAVLFGGVGVASGKESSGGEEIWSFETGDRVFSSPTVVDGTVFVGSNDNNVYALDAESGDEQWAFETAGSIQSSPNVVDGTVVVGSDDTKIYALDAATGDEQWAFDPGGYGWADISPTISDGTVFLGGPDSQLYAVDVETGDEQWSFDTGNFVSSSPTVVNNTVYFGSSGNTVYAVNEDTGDEEWAFGTGGDVDSSPTVADGTVFVGSDDAYVYALDAESGDEQWEFETADSVRSSPTVADGTVFVGNNNGDLYALDASTGDEEWVFTGALQFVSSGPTVVNGTVFFGSSYGRVYALDAATGDEHWNFGGFGFGFSSSPTVVDGTVYAGSSDDNVYALDAGVEGSSEDSRVNLGTLGHHHVWAEESDSPGESSPVEEALERYRDAVVEYTQTYVRGRAEVHAEFYTQFGEDFGSLHAAYWERRTDQDTGPEFQLRDELQTILDDAIQLEDVQFQRAADFVDSLYDAVSSDVSQPAVADIFEEHYLGTAETTAAPKIEGQTIDETIDTFITEFDQAIEDIIDSIAEELDETEQEQFRPALASYFDSLANDVDARRRRVINDFEDVADIFLGDQPTLVGVATTDVSAEFAPDEVTPASPLAPQGGIIQGVGQVAGGGGGSRSVASSGALADPSADSTTLRGVEGVTAATGEGVENAVGAVIADATELVNPVELFHREPYALIGPGPNSAIAIAKNVIDAFIEQPQGLDQSVEITDFQLEDLDEGNLVDNEGLLVAQGTGQLTVEYPETEEEQLPASPVFDRNRCQIEALTPPSRGDGTVEVTLDGSFQFPAGTRLHSSPDEGVLLDPGEEHTFEFDYAIPADLVPGSNRIDITIRGSSLSSGRETATGHVSYRPSGVLPDAEVQQVAAGTLEAGEEQSTDGDIPTLGTGTESSHDTVPRLFSLSYNGGDLHLQIVDDDGNVVGRDPDTGEYVVEIPGAESSGSDDGRGSEWVSLPAETTVESIIVSATEAPDNGAGYTLTRTTYGDLEPSVGVQPGRLDMTIQPGELQSRGAVLYEATGVADSAVTVSVPENLSAVTSDELLPGTAITVNKTTVDVAAGGTEHISVLIDAPEETSQGTYEGELKIESNQERTLRLSVTILSGVLEYTNDNDIVDTDGLREATDDWRAGAIETEILRDVIDAWRSGDPVE